ncbi:hypothetical protein [Pseudomonas sp. UM16]|uniref:hypothetical protein n=1 Tax=Pseudomonas sp. UM16 TaxID=3158962 RepID=UPI0039903651
MTVSPTTDPGHFPAGRQRYNSSANANRRYATMFIQVSASAQKPDCPWQVRLDQHVVSFRSEAEARAFVNTLQTRLQAPHPLKRVG